MSEVIRKTSPPHYREIPFHAVHSVKGNSGAGSFVLSKAKGFSAVCAAHGHIRLVADSLQVQIIGDLATDQSCDLSVCLVPDGQSPLPSTSEEILTVPGSTFTQHSVYLRSTLQPLGFPPEVGKEPRVVYYFKILYGYSVTEAIIRVSGRVAVDDDVGFTQTW